MGVCGQLGSFLCGDPNLSKSIQRSENALKYFLGSCARSGQRVKPPQAAWNPPLQSAPALVGANA